MNAKQLGSPLAAGGTGAWFASYAYTRALLPGTEGARLKIGAPKLRKPRHVPTCLDCGERGAWVGHMECQYPGRYSEALEGR